MQYIKIKMLKYISKMSHLYMCLDGPQLISSTWYVFEVFFILSDKPLKTPDWSLS